MAVSRFIMLIQLSPGAAGSPRAIAEHAARISAALRHAVPHVQLVQRHVVKNHCDLVDVLEAPNLDVIEHAANVVESLGHRVTDVMIATAWESMSPVAGVQTAHASSTPDPVQEASEESFPASDSPAWTGSIVTKAPVSHINPQRDSR